MSDVKKRSRFSGKKLPRSKPGIVVLSSAVGCLAPIVLGVVYGLFFLTSWNVWPAFIIIGALLGLFIGLIIGVLIAYFSK